MRYCKSTIFQANHNPPRRLADAATVVCDTAKVRFFKQITTLAPLKSYLIWLFAILQKYDFSSKSQLNSILCLMTWCCLRYCKSTIFQANHNGVLGIAGVIGVVCDTAKVRFFKQITTAQVKASKQGLLFAILQKYDFSSKSQLNLAANLLLPCCLRYCKSTIFQANHNINSSTAYYKVVVCDTAKVRFFKQITTEDMAISNSILLFAILQKYDFSSKSQLLRITGLPAVSCLRYCKSTIFQANHNSR